VVPADGFFEWTGPKTVRLPFWFHTPQPQPFGFAGLYRDVADPKTGETQRTFTILTTRANELVAAAHHRMPAVLEPATIPLWLSPPPTSSLDHEAFVRSLTDALAPAANDRLVATPVSARVNDVRNDDPACLEEGQPEGQLELPSQGPEK
jgi:putative SOS response-associated peptidase YedK